MDNTKTDLIQTIQQQIAIEHYDNEEVSWENMPGYTQLQYWPEVCKRYAFEVAKASLNEASEKAKLKTTFKDQVIQSDFARLQSCAQVSVDKESINSVINISL